MLEVTQVTRVRVSKQLASKGFILKVACLSVTAYGILPLGYPDCSVRLVYNWNIFKEVTKILTEVAIELACL